MLDAARIGDPLALLWRRPDPQALELARAGEVLTAKVRLWVFGVGALIPIENILLRPPDVEPWVGLGGAVLILALGAAVLALARRPEPPRGLSLFSSLLDVTTASAVNAGFLLAGHPLAATNSRLVFNLYFLGLACTCLRLDARLCVGAGLAAMAQYGGIVLWAVNGWDLRGPLMTHSSYGAFRWDNQIARLLLLAMATAINAVIVAHNRRYWRASLYDLLTGLPNRRYAQVWLHQALAMARRTRRGLVLALADLDLFKQVNDRYGHAAGDEVLRHAATELRRWFRGSDLVARYGGEEFLILLPEAETGAALARLERFHASFAALPAWLPGANRPLAMTISLGVAVFPADGDNPADLLDRADQRLYRAKQAGRNRLEGP